MIRRAGCCLALAFAQAAWGMEWAASYALTPDASRSRTGSPYAQPESRAGNGWRQDIGLRAAAGGGVGQFNLRTEARFGERAVTHIDVNQLYLDHTLAEGAGRTWGLTAGKKILASPIGFGFRPLDVIQQENRRRFNAPPLTGVPLVAVDRLTAGDALGLVASGRPDEGPQREALTLRATHGADTYEIHAVAQGMAGQGGAFGIGAMGTPPGEGDSAWDTAWHGAALWQRRAPVLRHRLADDPAGPPLATGNPLQPDERAAVWKTVAGVQFSHGSGWGLLLEYWHDGSAWRASEWRRLDRLTRRQQALAGLAPMAAIQGNLAWSAGAFAAPSLLPDNVMARLSYTAESWNGALEWLATPEDGGNVLTLGLTREGNRQKGQFGWQHLAGPADSAYGQAPTRDFLFVRWLWAL
ncbi:MAG: hypothetical protein H6R10_1947 [Rhodocyclaceae bacterium]|nr:hypothetical protein [Rhodocyclaceae bacterium]